MVVVFFSFVPIDFHLFQAFKPQYGFFVIWIKFETFLFYVFILHYYSASKWIIKIIIIITALPIKRKSNRIHNAHPDAYIPKGTLRHLHRTLWNENFERKSDSMKSVVFFFLRKKKLCPSLQWVSMRHFNLFNLKITAFSPSSLTIMTWKKVQFKLKFINHIFFFRLELIDIVFSNAAP